MANTPITEWVRIHVDRIKAETAAAFLLVIGDEGYWVPKSQMHDPRNHWRGQMDVVVIVSEWIAEQKGFLGDDDDDEDEEPVLVLKGWWTVLFVAHDAPMCVVEAAYKALIRECHPDKSGSKEAAQRINGAMDDCRKERGIK